MLQEYFDCVLKSTLCFSTSDILSQLQIQKQAGWNSAWGASSSQFSSSLRMALEMHFWFWASRRTTQQESMFRTPPLTILHRRTEQLPLLITIIIIRPLQSSNRLPKHEVLLASCSQTTYNNFNRPMSASLPRIKTIQELPQPPKFRKITLGSENQEERKASLKSLKTERLKSLSRYSTVQQQREYKKEKIHLNLIERKLLSGTYDEKKETGQELNTLKQKCDQFKVETALKTRAAERVKQLLNQVKHEIAQMAARKEEAEKKLTVAKEKYEWQLVQTEAAREAQAVLDHMLTTRQDVNLNLCKRKNELQGDLDHLNSLSGLIEKELREARQRVKAREAGLEELIQRALQERNQRNEIMAKHQERIVKRKEDEILHSERSRQYLADLEQVEVANELREFNAVYHNVLANMFMASFTSSTLLALHQKYEAHEHAYRKLYSYRSFNPQEPHTLLDRFLEHSVEKAERQASIREKEQAIEYLQQQRQKLKDQLAAAQNQLLENEQKMTRSQISLEGGHHEQQIAELQQESKRNEERSSSVRGHLLRLLNLLKRRGDRRSGESQNESALKNAEALCACVLDLAKED